MRLFKNVAISIGDCQGNGVSIYQSLVLLALNWTVTHSKKKKEKKK